MPVLALTLAKTVAFSPATHTPKRRPAAHRGQRRRRTSEAVRAWRRLGAGDVGFSGRDETPEVQELGENTK